MNLSEILDSDILKRVEKPSRYLGNEVNSVHKDKESVDVRLALVFPDLYDLGLGNLGLHILYAILNRLPWVWCERAYAPGVDMEHELRSRDLKLFALESRDSLDQFDGLGITLQSELTYTNILNILDMSGIPLRTADRSDDHPLTFAGGPAVFNPEPLAPFMDFFVIGDGEDAISEIAQIMRDTRGQSRMAKLEALAKVEGVYVPALYPFETTAEGRILPKEDAPKIRKRLTNDLNGATFPTDYIVPFTQQVHDRISLEVLRGCTQGCRFCQAGMTTRPVRERKIDKIDDLMRRTLENTGYEEVSLVSLSTCDYSQVRRMVNRAVETAREKRASISLPSLRLDSFSVGLADMVAETRRSGITFAPEAASPRLRSVINKFIPDEELLKMSSGAYELGWTLVKLYFMIGLPTERDDDVDAIADLAIRTLAQGKQIMRKARVNLGVSTFVPKPFTPFQWAPQIPMEETRRRQEMLFQKLRFHKSIKFGRHDARETFIEGMISRSDRRAGDLLEAAFRRGARFDAWGEHLKFEAWEEAIEEVGFDVDDALRERKLDERLPWDHIDILIDKEWFVEDWQRAMELKWAQDCRHRKCLKCGVIDKERELCATMLRDHVKGRWAEKTFVKPERPMHEEGPVAQRLWIRYARTGSARFLSHLEANSAWMRAFRRARLPLSFSQGFRPKPRVAFSSALPAGEETVGDYIDVRLSEAVDPREIYERLRTMLPEGFDVFSVQDVPLKAPALMDLVAGATYTFFMPEADRLELAQTLSRLRVSQELMITRKIKKGKNRVMTEVNIRPMIHEMRLRSGETAAVDVTLVSDGKRVGRPRDLMPLLTDQLDRIRILKHDSLYKTEDGWESISQWTPPPAPEPELDEDAAPDSAQPLAEEAPTAQA